MKVKVVTLDVSVPRSLQIAVALAIAGCVGVALAAPSKTFTAGETLTAAALNENFANVDTRLAALEATAKPGLALAEDTTMRLQVHRGTFTVSNGSVARASSGELTWGYLQIPSDATVIGVTNISGLHQGCSVEPRVNTAHTASGQRILIAIRGFSDAQCMDVDVLTFQYVYLRP